MAVPKSQPRGILPPGGLVCRALLSVMEEHNVDSFISLSSPQMGQYGGEWGWWAPERALSFGDTEVWGHWILLFSCQIRTI